MKKLARKPLSLDRKTIRTLASASLERVGGAYPKQTNASCQDSVDWYCAPTVYIPECLPLPG